MSSPGSGFSFKRKKCVADNVETFLDMNTLHNWSLEDLTKAGKLLRKPPIQCKFLDEHEMRRVYSMIYDVFRCEYNFFYISVLLIDLQFLEKLLLYVNAHVGATAVKFFRKQSKIDTAEQYPHFL